MGTKKNTASGTTKATQGVDTSQYVQTAATDTKGTKIGQAEIDNAAQSKTAIIDKTEEAQFRAKQMAFADLLQAQISGNGAPSPAMLQFQSSVDQAISTQMAVARSGGGPLAMRQALTNTATMTQQAANQAAQLKATESLAARSQLADVLNQGRTADINLAENQAQLEQQTNISNAQLTEQQILANQAARNSRNTAQGQLNTSIHNTDTQANAQLGAASISAAGAVKAAGAMASAQNNATEAANYRFNEGLMASMDQQNYQNGMGAAGGAYNVDTNAIKQQQQINANMEGSLDAAGGAMAGMSKYPWSSQGVGGAGGAGEYSKGGGVVPY